MNNNYLVRELDAKLELLGYTYFKNEKKCRIYKKILIDYSVHYIRINMDTGVLSKKTVIYNDIMNSLELDAIPYIYDLIHRYRGINSYDNN